MKKLLFILTFALIANVCLGLVGCSNNQVNNVAENMLFNQQESTSTDTPPLSNETNPDDVDINGMDSADYTLMEKSGVHYIVFSNILDYNNEEQNELANLEFESLSEFRNTVTNGKLADWQKKVIATSFKKNEVGVLTCDFNKLLEPQLPNDCRIDGVSWSGESYSFYVSTSFEVFGFVHNYSQEQYNEIYNKDFENYFSKPTITVKEVQNTEDGKTVTMYSTSAGDLMQIRYTYVDKEKTVIVDETYRLNMGNESLTTSNMVPTNITLYCTEPGASYVIDLFGFVEKPSDTWLYEFGMKRYVDLDTSEK